MDRELLKNLLKKKENGVCYFDVKIHPISPKSEIKGVMADGTVKINIAALPQQGKANQELIRFLSTELGIAQQKISIESGFASPRKKVKIVL